MTHSNDSSPTPRLSRLLTRLIDRDQRSDYLVLALFAAIPVVLSIPMGLFWSRATERGIAFKGYGDAPNFWTLVFLLPGLLWLIRWAMNRIAPVSREWPPSEEPPILALLDTPAGKRVAYEGLRRWVLSPRVATAALVLAIAINVIDMSGFLLADYVNPADPPVGAYDWRNLHRSGLISLSANLLFALVAYTVQFAMVWLGCLCGLLLLAHNLYFLRHVYQRRWVPDGQEDHFFEINLADEDRCFGFREANSAFNTQIMLLMGGGLMMLFSRYQYSATWDEMKADPTAILPTVGQVMMVGGWFVGLCVISLPALVKLLPRLPFIGNQRASRRIGSYLLEFMSPRRWPFGLNPRPEEIAALAARFASHSFWPTGNNRGAQLFFFALWIGQIVLIAPPLDNPPLLAASVLTMGLIAWGAKALIMGALHSSLRYVDDGLVDPPSGPLPELRLPGRKLDAGIFVSYRRQDSAAYTGRLYDYLSDHVHRDQIFLDIHAIGAGEKYGDVLNRNLSECAAVLVMIGPRWLSSVSDNGAPRLADPDDWVRAEVAAALARDILVVPVLVGGAQLPSPAELPADLAPLCDRNAFEISDTRWDYDARRLMAQLRGALDARQRTAG